MDTNPPPLVIPGDCSPTIGALAAALAKAQGEIRNAAKDAKNAHFNNRYADLAAVWDACRGALSKNGLAVLQPVSWDGNRVVVRTLIAHSSGEWIAESLSARPQQDSPQGIGSTITYLRRYGLAAMVGVAPDDDDAEAAEGRGGPAQARPAPRQEPRPSPRPERREEPKSDGHDPSWDKDRPKFFAALRDIGVWDTLTKAGVAKDDQYPTLAAWCDANGHKRPSAMTDEERHALHARLNNADILERLAAFARDTNPNAASAAK